MTTLATVLIAFLPVFVHMFGTCALLPIGEGVHSYAARASVALALSLSLYSDVNIISSNQVSIFSLPTHFLIGLLSSLPVVLMLHAASGVGEIIEAGRGMTIGQVIDPHYELPEVSLAQLARWGMLSYLASIGIIEKVFLASISSYHSAANSVDAAGEAIALVMVLSKSISISLIAAVPFLIVYLCIEMTGAMISRVLPGLSLSSELFIVKAICAGFLLLAVACTGIEESVAAVYNSFGGS